MGGVHHQAAVSHAQREDQEWGSPRTGDVEKVFLQGLRSPCTQSLSPSCPWVQSQRACGEPKRPVGGVNPNFVWWCAPLFFREFCLGMSLVIWGDSGFCPVGIHFHRPCICRACDRKNKTGWGRQVAVAVSGESRGACSGLGAFVDGTAASSSLILGEAEYEHRNKRTGARRASVKQGHAEESVGG